MELDFVNGTVTDSAGTVTNMNSNLNYYGLNECGSIAVFVSDSDAEINIGNNLSIADHQLTHIINAYNFSNVRIKVPSNSTPDVNQVIMASTDSYLGYIINNYAHTRAETTSTTTDAWVTLWSKHVGGYDQTILTTVNTTTASNSMDLKIQFSENGSDWYDVQGYTATNGVAIAGGATPDAFDQFSTDILHHFYRARIKATSSGNQANVTFFWNLVQYT